MELNAIELSIYDFIMGYQMLTETIEPSIMGNRTKTFHKALMWFRENNPEAYHILLD
jgi:hypothetical protein